MTHDRQRLCVVGTGLIGCSFALALKNAGFKGHIVGSARKQATLDEALRRDIIDSADTDPAKAVENADLVLVSVPMLAVDNVLEKIAPALKPGAILTDAGSVKGSFVASARQLIPDLANLVPGHPIAGRERSGVEATDATLYRNKRVILTPLPETASSAVEQVSALWKMTGALVECLDIETHDRVLAATSHLPHLLAFGLVDMLATRQENEEIFRYAAGGFRDFTRIASGDPVMWRDICMTNTAAISDALDDLQSNLSRLKGLLDNQDADALEQVFLRAKTARDKRTASLE